MISRIIPFSWCTAARAAVFPEIRSVGDNNAGISFTIVGCVEKNIYAEDTAKGAAYNVARGVQWRVLLSDSRCELRSVGQLRCGIYIGANKEINCFAVDEINSSRVRIGTVFIAADRYTLAFVYLGICVYVHS